VGVHGVGHSAGYWPHHVVPAQIEAKELHLIDVRTQSEWENGFIEGAIHIPLRDLMTSQWPDSDANIVVYGSTNHRGALALAIMHMMGYTNVRSLAGSTGAWEAAGLPLVTE
jgi:rhodanese-related sulfurtransferase